MSRPLADFAIRALSAGLLGAVMLATILYGGVWGVAALASVIGVLAGAELVAITRRERRTPNTLAGLAAIVALPLAAARFGADGIAPVLAALVVGALIWHVAFRSLRLADTAITVFGAAYIGLPFAHLVLLRQLPDGVSLCLVMVFGVWANDVFAYLAGSTFGRTPMAPRISPKKTWEGFLAGTLATTLVWAVVGTMLTDLPLDRLIIVGLAASLAAAIGDLAESRIKREMMVKDSGRLLPGHGGFLDRFDSFILVTIVTYHVLVLAGAR